MRDRSRYQEVHRIDASDASSEHRVKYKDGLTFWNPGNAA